MRFSSLLGVLVAISRWSVDADNASEAAVKERVAILVPSNPRLHPKLKAILDENLHAVLEANPRLDLKIYVDSGPLSELPEDQRPLSKIARLRNRMLDSIDLGSFDYLVWIDSDVVEFPADLPTTLILANPQGVTAPVVLIEEPGPLGPSQFYDTTGFVLKGRSESDPTNTDPYVEGRSVLKFPPYIPGRRADDDDLVDLDGVGTCYSIPARVFVDGKARFQDHPRLTEHFSVIQKAREMGLRVAMHMRVTVRHAHLPKYGSDWHSNVAKK